MPRLELCDEHIEIRNVEEFLVQGPYHGHDGVRRWFAEAFDVISDPRFELDEVIDGGDGETIVTVQRVLGHSGHTGLELHLRWALVWTIRGGKVAFIQGYAGRREALKAAGLRE
ncbi:MAG: nuclear transport factor 2 family protein [Actinomycetota bacterium]|nr:nuclear transport factor 2 family protein [Actinomycetota bacterium]